MLSRHFGVCATTVKDILARDLGLKTFTRRWPSYTVRPTKNEERRGINCAVTDLNDLEADSFDGIATGDESWFQYLCESSAMFAKSPGDVTPRTSQGIGMKKTTFTLFFTNRKLLIAEYLPKGQKYNQDYFISDILPELEHDKIRYEPRKQDRIFFVHMDHSISHEGGKAPGKIRHERPRTRSASTLFS
jgi:hypothetical protein